MSSLNFPSASARLVDANFASALQIILENAPSAFAVTEGPAHTLVYANDAFRRVFGAPEANVAAAITDVLLPEAITRMQSLLDRALTSQAVLHERFLGLLARGKDYRYCTIWPLSRSTRSPGGLVIELHRFGQRSQSLALQREVTERLLLSALQQADAADRAATSLARSEYLTEAGLRLGKSFDTTVTRTTVAALSPPVLGAWCVVDLFELDGSVSRLAMIHPDPAKQELLRELARHWTPRHGDPFGAPAIKRGSAPLVISHNIDEALERAAHSPENLRLLRELEIATLLTVPMVRGDQLLGAITFLRSKPGKAYQAEDLALAMNLAARSAEALENARIYEEALTLRAQAEVAVQKKLDFLGSISHELRTPLNAIGGFVELITEEIHGPVTDAQRADLERIRINQEHLIKLVNELLAYVRGAPRANQIIALRAHDEVARAVGLIGNTLAKRSLTYEHDAGDPDLIMYGDAERVRQILVNLLANAVKFTQRGGHITTRCAARGDQVHVSVIDNGIGIAPQELDAIFEPFVQVSPSDPADGGVGLGLAISRDLARTMRGDLVVQSTLGKGTCFTLCLPRELHSTPPAKSGRSTLVF